MIVDKKYCMSSFLMYRATIDKNKCYSDKFPPYFKEFPKDRMPIYSSDELYETLRDIIQKKTQKKKCAIALSGGIDSAILLKLMPENTVAYTFKCVVPGIEVTDETKAAKKYLEYARPEIEHKIVPIYWENFEEYAPLIMKHKGEPTHSIEIQIYKAALQAKADGCDILVFGETADCIYGGHSQLLSRDWTFGEFVDRWSFVMPHHVLKEPMLVLEPIKQYEKDGYIDVPKFLTYFESEPSLNFYMNACDLAGIDILAPYAYTIMGNELDLERVRKGENKYIVREVFEKLYPDFQIPPKTPMPRPTNEWFKDWKGPVRPEFIPHCTDNMTGDQKWLVWALEKFLDLIEFDYFK